MPITVNKLLRKPFMNRTRREKKDIVLEGKPRPILSSLKSTEMNLSSTVEPAEDSACNYVIVFDQASYDDIEWLTGCDIRQALFCWPCLLFRYTKKLGMNSFEYFCNESGLTDLTNLREKIRQHENDVLHIQAFLDLKLFASKIKVEKPEPLGMLLEKEKCERNREMAKRIIDVICYLVTQQKYPQGGFRDQNTLQVDDCVENLNFVRDYDIVQRNLIDDIIYKMQKTPNIVADMIEAITSCVKREILKELQNSRYASVILTQHLPERTRSQISAVIRYLKNGEVCERFVGFSNRDRLVSAGMICQLITKINWDFQIFDKTIAYSLDDSLTIAKNESLLKEVKEIFSIAGCCMQFVPCHFHDLEDVLLRSLSFSVECDLFLKNIMVIGSYFEKDSSVCLKFSDSNTNADSGNDYPLSSAKHYSAFLLNTIKAHRIYIKDTFDRALYDPQNLSECEVVQLKVLSKFLIDFKAIFILETLTKLMDLVAPLAEALKNPFPGLAFDDNLIEGVLTSFDDELSEGTFDRFWLKVVDIFHEQVNHSCLSLLHSRTKHPYGKLFFEIVQCLRYQISHRFEGTSKFAFCQILDLENSASSLNPDHVSTLVANYGQSFDYTQLSGETKLVVLNKSAMNCKSVHELYKFLVTSKLGDSFTNLNNLCEIALSLPSTIPNAPKTNKTKLDVIDSWSYTNIVEQHSRDITFLCVEQDYLMQLKKKNTFYDNVICDFRSISETLELE